MTAVQHTPTLDMQSIDGRPYIKGKKRRENIRRCNADLLEALELEEAFYAHQETSPDYDGMTRDTHPNGEAIWRKWWNEGLDLCAKSQAARRAAIAKARGQQ